MGQSNSAEILNRDLPKAPKFIYIVTISASKREDSIQFITTDRQKAEEFIERARRIKANVRQYYSYDLVEIKLSELNSRGSILAELSPGGDYNKESGTVTPLDD